MTTSRFWSTCFCSALLAALAAPARGADGGAGGRAAYQRFCAPCHGDRGDGRGPAARGMDPAPRDFTKGIYKFRSTASGALPLSSDLRRTIDDGLRGTAMPGWRAVLPVEDRAALVAFLRGFSSRFATDPPGEVVPVPPPPPADAGAVSRGRRVYERMRCGECHGPEGRGDGPSTPTLRDDRGRPVLMPDMTRTRTMKRVSSERDVIVTYLTGLDGTPMPSYRDVIWPAQMWDLARYTRAIARPVRWWERLLLQPPVTWARAGVD